MFTIYHNNIRIKQFVTKEKANEYFPILKASDRRAGIIKKYHIRKD